MRVPSWHEVENQSVHVAFFSHVSRFTRTIWYR
jgi:hypothetical protein